MAFCALTGHPCDEPVVDTTRGYMYEKRVIMKHLEEEGTCPFSKEAMGEGDLVEVKSSNTVVKPRPPTANSIPAMLQLFQNEWDALMLESFHLKQQLEQVRKELAHSLYQHDAACRVIARLIKERDSARGALANVPGAAIPAADGATPMEGVEAPQGITKAVVKRMTDKSKTLAKQRKKRQPSKDLPTPEVVASYEVQGSHNLHASSSPGVTCVAINPRAPNQILTGGVDKNAVVFDLSTEKVVATLKGHHKKLTSVAFHPTQDLIFTTSADKTARIVGTDTYKSKKILKKHTGEVVGCTVHATGDYLVTASTDKTWCFWDIGSGNALAHVEDSNVDAGYSCVKFHPDGLILATGTMDSFIRIWDVKTQKNLATFKGHEGVVKDVSFSENGYYLASIAEDSTIKLWDLRTLKNFRTIALRDGSNVHSIAFDYSGTYLASAGDNITVFTDFGSGGDDANIVQTYTEHSEAAMGIAFAPDASFFASVSMDRSLKIWSGA